MKKQFFSALALLSVLASCSDKVEENPSGGNNDYVTLKSILYNGEEITANSEIEVTNQTKSHFVIDVSNQESREIVWLLGDEVVGQGSNELTLEGRSGELSVGLIESVNSGKVTTRATATSYSQVLKVAKLSGLFSKGVFGFSTHSSTGTNGSKHLVFINNDLVTTDSYDILLDENPSLSNELQLEGAYDDLDIYKNRLYLAQSAYTNTENLSRLIEVDAQTLKVLKIHKIPSVAIHKLAMLDRNTILTWSSFDGAFTKGNLITGDWDENYAVLGEAEEFEAEKVLNASFYRSEDQVAFAYGSRIIVLNSDGEVVNEVEMGEGYRVISMIKDSQLKNSMKVVVEAKSSDSNEFIDVETYPARILTLNSSFDIIREVEHRLRFVKDGVTHEEKRGFGAYYHQSDLYNQGLVLASSPLKDVCYYLRNSEFGIDVYELHDNGVSEKIFNVVPQSAIAAVSTKPCIDINNRLFIPVMGGGQNQIHIYDLNNKGQYLDHITFDSYYPIAVLATGTDAKVN